MSIEYKNSNTINLHQNKININIAGRDVQCLIDSGSMKCAIKSSFFHNLLIIFFLLIFIVRPFRLLKLNVTGIIFVSNIYVEDVK